MRLTAQDVAALRENQNWQALAGRWAELRASDSFSQIADFVDTEARRMGPPWPTLAEFLRSLMAWPDLEKAEKVQPWHDYPLSDEDKLSILLLVVCCDQGLEATPGQDDAITRLQSEVGCEVIHACSARWGDVPLEAFACTFVGHQSLEKSRDLIALGHFKSAVEIYRPLAETQPSIYQAHHASALHNRGRAERATGDADAALRSYEAALSIRQELSARWPETFAEGVARTCQNLGNTQTKLEGFGEAARWYGEAANSFRDLAMSRGKEYREVLANVLETCALAGGVSDRLDSGRVCLMEAVEIYRVLAQEHPKVYRPDVARSLKLLGDFQGALNELKSAWKCHEEALGIFRALSEERPEIYQPQVAGCLNNLGAGLRLLNELESARECVVEALGIYRELAMARSESYRRELAMSLNNLGNILRDLEELESARICYEETVGIFLKMAKEHPETYRLYLAGSLNNLGAILKSLNELARARICWEMVLGIYRELAMARSESYRPELAMSLNNLGAILMSFNELESAQVSCGKSVGIYRELAKTFPEVYRPNLAASLITLGNVLRESKELESARVCHEEAISIYDDIAGRHDGFLLVEQRDAHKNLGQLIICQSSPDLAAARVNFRRARVLAEKIRGGFRGRRHRQRVLAESKTVYEGLVLANLAIWRTTNSPADLEEAVEVVEATRSRELLDLLADELVLPVDTPEGLTAEFSQVRRRLDQLRRQLDAEFGSSSDLPRMDFGGGEARGIRLNVGLDSASANSHPREREDRLPRLQRELDAAEALYKEKLEEIQKHDPFYNPDRPVEPLGYGQMCDLIPDSGTVMVQTMFSAKEGLTLVIKKDGIVPVSLEGLDGGVVKQKALDWINAYYRLRGGGTSWYAEWAKFIREQLSFWEEQFVRPLIKHLPPDTTRLVLSLNQAAQLIPFHACQMPDGHRLGDVYEVVYTPSFSLLHRCWRMPHDQRGNEMIVQNPTADLPFAQAEGVAYRQRYPNARSLEKGNAMRETILAEAPESREFCYTGHAYFNPQDPLASGLVLGGLNEPAQWLTLRHVFTEMNLRRNVITVLNGCESGMLALDGTEEYTGLPAGFLYAGSSCVISTLWAVNDLSSALVMDRFHEERSKGEFPAAALRNACRWLRDKVPTGVFLRDKVMPDFLSRVNDPNDPTLRQRCEEAAALYARDYPDSPPFSSPAHWAPYICSGLGYQIPSVKTATNQS